MKKIFFTFILFATPHMIFSMNKTSKKKYISQSHDSHQSEQQNHILSQSDSTLIINREREESNIKSLTPEQIRSNIIKQKIKIFKNHTKHHNSFDNSRQFILNPNNKKIVSNCFECLAIRKRIYSIKVNN